MASYMLCAFFTFELDLAAKGTLEDPEHSGGISLLCLVRNCKQKGKREDLEVPEVVVVRFPKLSDACLCLFSRFV